MRALKARPTVYAGIHMRSRLEARFAQELDRRHVRWRYEPLCFASKTGQYLPDFEILGKGFPSFVEVKPTDQPGAQDRMLIIHATYPWAELTVAWPTGNGWQGWVWNPSDSPDEGMWFHRNPLF